VNLEKYDPVPVFMAATPDFLEKNPDAAVNYLKAWLDVAKDFKSDPKKVSGVIYDFFKSKGYTMSPETFAKAMSRIDVEPGFPQGLEPYMKGHAEALLKEKKIAALPDFKKMLRTDLMEKARAGA